jgi:sirohydrochlorin ferrochelatase
MSRWWIRIVMLGMLAVGAGAAPAQPPAGGGGASATGGTGVLLMAHGGSKSWNAQVREVAGEVDRQMPTEVAFGMADRKTLQAGIDALTGRGVTAIVAVPLFVSSHSSVIESTKYLLGLRPDAPEELAYFVMDMDHDHAGMSGQSGETDTAKSLPKPVTSQVPIRMAPALDHHPLVADILADRAAAIAKDPAHDAVILVAHGPNSDAANDQWLADMAALGARIGERVHYARIEWVTVRDDADEAVRDAATAKLRSLAEAANAAGNHVLVVPLLLSYGGIEDGIRKRLDGIEHVFSPQALLPDPRLAQWVLASARDARPMSP